MLWNVVHNGQKLMIFVFPMVIYKKKHNIIVIIIELYQHNNVPNTYFSNTQNNDSLKSTKLQNRMNNLLSKEQFQT